MIICVLQLAFVAHMPHIAMRPLLPLPLLRRVGSDRFRQEWRRDPTR